MICTLKLFAINWLSFFEKTVQPKSFAMKKILRCCFNQNKLFLLAPAIMLCAFFVTKQSIAQPCPNNNTLADSIQAPTLDFQVVSKNAKANEYVLVKAMNAGVDYRISTCANGVIGFNSKITVYDVGGIFKTDNSGFCGPHSELVFKPQVSGNYKVLIDRDIDCNFNSIQLAQVDIEKLPPPPPPGAYFNWTDGLCEGDTVFFTDMSIPDSAGGPIDGWFWDFGDGDTAVIPNPKHVYAIDGFYDVWLWISDSAGNVDSAYNEVWVNNCSGAGFYYDGDCNGDTVYFQDVSMPFGGGPIVAWNWTIIGNGDTATFTIPFPSYVPMDTGLYEVTLTVTDSAGGTETIIQYPFIRECYADFDWDGICTSDTIFFYDMSDTTFGPLAAWFWDFGDGITDSVQNPWHVYPGPGIYNVYFEIKNTTGNIDFVDYDVDIYDCGTNFWWNYVCLNDTTEFYDASIFGSGVGLAVAWQWDFGDGNTDTIQNPKHVFASEGAYNVTLIATDFAGGKDTITYIVDIWKCCAVDWYWFADTSKTAYFQGLSWGNPPFTWQWDFGDSTTGNVPNPLHQYADTGMYIACLTSTDASGCTDTWCDTVYIGVGPPPCFSDWLYVVDTNNTAYFIDNSYIAGSGPSWSWSFGDSTSGVGPNPVHTFPDTGEYVVCLTIADTIGCSDTWCDTVKIGVSGSPCYSDWNYYTDTTTMVFFNETALGPAEMFFWDFGDSTYSTNPNPVHIFPSTGPYWVCLTIADSAGTCGDTWCQQVNVGTPPPCLSDWDYFTDSTTTGFFTAYAPPGTMFAWEFGDGATSAMPNPAHIYDSVGTYWVCLTVSDSTGCSDTKCEAVTVGYGPPCNADFYFFVDSTDVYFADNSNANYWVWDFGDGNTSFGPNPAHTYDSAGFYWVCLTIADTNTGCTDTWCIDVAVGLGGPPCSADWFHFSDTSTTAYFTDVSANAAQWQWEFGDGDTSYMQNPAHTFDSAGTYWVCLTVADSSGCVDQWCQQVNVGNQGPPPCNSNWDYGVMDSTAFFTAYAPPGTTFMWDFGDSTTSTVQNPAHNYTASGTYWVCLTVSNSTGCTDTWCEQVTVGVGVQNCATEWYYWSDSTYAFFTDISPGATAWYWDFGDSSFSTSQNPIHQYASTGVYWVCLTISDSAGCTDTWCQPVNVGVGAICGSDWWFWSDSTTGYFSDVSTGNITSWFWEFGDGDSSMAQNPIHTYDSVGVYWVCLTVTDDSTGCEDTWCYAINVGVAPPCNADFTYYTDSTISYFVNFSAGNITGVMWDFGDSTASSDENPIHVYASPGTYWVCLTVMDSTSGCSDTWCEQVNIGVTGQCLAAYGVYTDSSNSAYFWDMSAGNITSWMWDFGDSTTSSLQHPDHTYASAGSYWVCLTVEDSIAGCTNTYCELVTVGDTASSCALSLTSSSTDANCAGASDGSATVSVNGGSTPYSYNWSNGGFSSTENGLMAGIYTVTVTDNDNCSANATATVSEPAAVTVSVTATDASCGNSNGTVTASASGGTGSFTYMWSNGGTDANASGLSAGSYTVSATDSAGCTGTAVAAISDSAGTTITVDAVTDVSTCAGGNNGSVAISISGGTSPYTYSWSTNETTEDINTLMAGTYTVTVTDSSGCVSSASATVSEPTGMSLTTTGNDANCGNTNGDASVSVNGGTSPYTYSWSSGGTDATETGLGAGTYTVSVTDANSCMDTTTATVSEIGATTVTIDSIVNVSCNGGSDGAIYLSVSGGTPPYTYAWTSGAITQDVTGLSANTYIVIITGSNGCQAIRSIVVDEPDALTISLSSTDATCGNANGSSRVIVTGGTSPYNYTWSDTTVTGSDPAGLDTGVYTVTVTDANGCSITATDTVGVTPQVPEICLVTTNADGWNTVVWDKTGHTGVDFYKIYLEVSTGVYQQIGSVPYDSLSKFVDPLNQPPQSNQERYKISIVDSCGNESALSDPHATMHLVLSIDVNDNPFLLWQGYEGFTVPNYIIWRGIDTANMMLIDSVVATTTIFTDYTAPASPDSLYYYVQVIHPGGGCTATKAAENFNSSRSNISSVKSPTQPLSATTSSTDETLTGACDGTATVTATNGTAPYSYLWDDTNSQTGSTATGLCAGTYNCTITDDNGDTLVISVTVNAAVGINSISWAGQIQLFPNPNEGVFKLVIESELDEEVVIKVFDLEGRIVLEEHIGKVTGQLEKMIDLSEASSGVYHLQVITDRSVANKKVIIE
ncbi:MAG: hypothetical protein COA57_08285 [Flavobacteriales bacterium]|nr:MAG: hypothetical protein COA57_08285 [Flavobacteriales bacterium]